MAEAAAVPVPEPASPIPADQPMGDIFRQYQAGKPEDMFAPAYIKGFAPSEQALNAWNAYHHNLDRGTIEDLRMPNAYMGPQRYSAGDGVYGGPIPLNMNTGDPAGNIDPEALRAWAQGSHYDIGARRNAIAARLAANAAAQAAVPATAPVELKKPVEWEPDTGATSGRYIY